MKTRLLYAGALVLALCVIALVACAAPTPAPTPTAASNASAILTLTAPQAPPGIEIGALAPDFALTDTTGRTVNLAEEASKHTSVIVAFYRYESWPYSISQLVGLAGKTKSFADKDAEIIALSNQDIDGARRTAAKTMNVEQVASMTILADLGGSAAMEWKMIASDGVDAPSALIINPERKVVWRYIGKTDYDNPPTTLIIGNQP